MVSNFLVELAVLLGIKLGLDGVVLRPRLGNNLRRLLFNRRVALRQLSLTVLLLRARSKRAATSSSSITETHGVKRLGDAGSRRLSSGCCVAACRAVDDIGRRHILVDSLLLHDAIGRNLPEHVHGIEPCPYRLQLYLVVDSSDRDALDVDCAAVGLRCDLLALVVDADVVVLHDAPVAPPEADGRRPAVYLQNLPCEGGHHALEGLVAARKVRVVGRVVLVRCDDGIVRADLKHGLSAFGLGAIDSKRVVLVVDGSPVLESGLE
jgi:hypothetical protein